MQIKTKIVSIHTADSKLVKQEVNGTVILPPLVFPAECHRASQMPDVVTAFTNGATTLSIMAFSIMIFSKINKT